jgi:hypothetical protein
MGDEAYHEESGGAASRDPSLEDVANLCRELNERGAKYIVVGGFAIILHGYPRGTTDIDFLVETSLENEARVLAAIATLADHAAAKIRPGEVSENVVVRVADEVMVDLMQSGCGVTFAEAVSDAVMKEVHGVKFPIASPETLWRMKQTVREKDIPDKIFLQELAQKKGLTLDPPPKARPPEVAPWADKLLSWLRHVLRKR